MRRQHLYRFLCNCLALDFHPELAKVIKDQLNNESIPWSRFISLSSNQFVLQIIYRIFQEHQLLDAVPNEVSSEMQRIQSLIAERNKEMINQSFELNSILNKENIEPIFLKGMGNLMQGLYASDSDRLLADIDVLIPFHSLDTGIRALSKHGFTYRKKLDPNLIPKLKHYPRIYKPGSLFAFEVHWEPLGPKYRSLLTESATRKEKLQCLKYPDCFTMSWPHAIQHSFIHSQLEHKAHAQGRVYLRYLYDLALMSKKSDVNEALESLNGYHKEVATYLYLAKSSFYIESINSESLKAQPDKLFILKHNINLRFSLPKIITRLFHRVYKSYVEKFFRLFFDKDLRLLILHQLSKKSWYKHHIDTYRKMFRPPTREQL